MKLLVVWPLGDKKVDIILQAIQKAGHEIVYWVGENPAKDFTPKDCVFHDHYDAWDAKPAPSLSHLRFAPPSASLIESMIATESSVLTMMNKHYDAAPVDERKHIYYHMIAYWSYVLDTYSPDALVFNDIPHSIYTNVIHDLGKARGIPSLSYEDTLTACRSMWYTDYWAGSDELRSAIASKHKGTVALSDLGEELQEYWREHTGEKWRSTPAQILLLPQNHSGWGLWKHRLGIASRTLLTGRFFPLAWQYLLRLGQANLKSEYSKLTKAPDYSRKYVYFPLHFQPERTTSPQGGVYVDQILAIETIAAALPEGWELYIKEHPSQWRLRGKLRYSSARYRGYYGRIAGIKGVRLVPIETDSFSLTEKAQAVAVITGTVGWEALLSGKRPLVFGRPWFRDCPGVFLVDSVESCTEAIAEIEGGATAAEDGVLRFLKAIEEVSIRAYLWDTVEEKPRYTPEQNIEIIAQHIVKTLRENPAFSRGE